MSEAKPFCISKWEVWEAYKRVKANQGAAGVDEQTIAGFERNLKGNLYKIWNRMSSGSYFPPPVRTVKIPKANGGERKLGIPTVSDRIAQMVVKSRLEPAVDPLFHPDSYGYRPGKSALDAVGQAWQRCWRYDWILDLDIKGFFDNIPQDLLIRAVKKHAKEQWMVLYIERWLQAPVQEEDGQLVPREKGTPQGGVISPLLANLFLHYAFDRWMAKQYPQMPFERYADDAIVHCRTEAEAQGVRAASFQLLRQIRVQFLAREPLQVIMHADTLPQPLMHLERQRAPQQRLADKQQREITRRVHVEVQQQRQLFERRIRQQMRFIAGSKNLPLMPGSPLGVVRLLRDSRA